MRLLPEPLSTCMAEPAKRLIASPLMTLPELPLPSTRPWVVSAAVPAAAPLSSITGAPAKSGSLVPSMITASVMAGNTEASAIEWGPLPAMLNRMRSAPPEPLAVLLAARIASRRLTRPSAPLLASRVDRLVVSPSLVSLAVSTVMLAWVPDTAATLRLNSEVSVKVL